MKWFNPKIGAWLAGILLIVTACFATTGCSAIKSWFSDDANKDLALRLVVYTAVDALIEKHPEYRDRIVDLSDKAQALLSSNPEATASMIISKTREDINWSKLSNEETVIADTLLNVLQDKIAERLNSGKLQDIDKARVAELIGWVKSAAIAAGSPSNKVTDNHKLRPTNEGAILWSGAMAKVSTCGSDLLAILSIGSGSGDSPIGGGSSSGPELLVSRSPVTSEYILI